MPCALSVFLLHVFISNFSYNKSKIFFWRSSSDFLRSSLIPSIRKLFLLDLYSRSTNFLQISNSCVGSVVCITPTSSFIELSSFFPYISSEMCTSVPICIGGGGRGGASSSFNYYKRMTYLPPTPPPPPPLTPLSKTCLSYSRNWKFSTQVHTHI